MQPRLKCPKCGNLMNFFEKDECLEKIPRYECRICGVVVYFTEDACPICQNPLLILKGDKFCEFDNEKNHLFFN